MIVEIDVGRLIERYGARRVTLAFDSAGLAAEIRANEMQSDAPDLHPALLEICTLLSTCANKAHETVLTEREGAHP